MHGVHEGYSVGILPGLAGGLVDQASHGVVGEHEPVDLLVDQVGRLAAQGGAGPEDVGLDLVIGGLDLPPLVVQRRELGGRRGAVVEQGGGEHDGLVASRDPARLEWSASVRAITVKKAAPRPVGWLTRAEMKALRDVPDRRTPRGRVEHALLLFLYNSGARVSEATALMVRDLDLGGHGDRHALVTLHGKGGKRRQCPLWPRTEGVLAELVKGRSANDAVFLSRYHRPYTRFGVYRLVERCAARVPELEGRTVTPHQIRHSGACHMLQSGNDINTIRAWLGHVSIDTTNIYAEIDLGMKARAMALCDAAEPGPDRPWKEDAGLMAFLDAL